MIIKATYNFQQVSKACEIEPMKLKEIIAKNEKIAALFIIQDSNYVLPAEHVSTLNSYLASFRRS